MTVKLNVNKDKVMAAVRAIAALNEQEFEFLALYMSLGAEAKVPLRQAEAKPEPQPEEKSRSRGPDPRGRFRCSLCGKVLPTKRGRTIHEKMHERETAPSPAAEKSESKA